MSHPASSIQVETRPYCAPVGDQFGDPTLPYDPSVPELLQSPDFAEFADAVAVNAEATHAHSETDLTNGEAAQRAIKALGCAACELHNVCTVETNLQIRIGETKEQLNIQQKAQMVGQAPVWLKAARLNNSGMTPARVTEIASNAEAAREAIKSGEFDALLGDTMNKRLAPVTRDQLPELANIKSIPRDKNLEADLITTKSGNSFVVIDAAINKGSKSDITDESRQEYGIMCAKLLERMSEVGADGLPPIFTADNKAQKVIRSMPKGKIFEIRMTGKNRLYLSLVRSPDGPDGPVARIVILGAHGGDASTQSSFIDVSLN